MNDEDDHEETEKTQGKAERQQARLKRQAMRAEKGKKADGGTDRTTRLCLLETVEVKKSPDGFHVFLDSSEGRRSFSIPKPEAAALLRDLEAAIHVMRAHP